MCARAAGQGADSEPGSGLWELLSAIGAGIIAADAEGRIVAANAAAAAAFGGTRVELAGRVLADLLTAADDDAAVSATGTRGFLVTKEGGRLPVRCASGPGTGDVAGRLAVFLPDSGGSHGRDTDAPDWRRALKASEERYRALVESHAEMLCRFRPDGTILFVNRAYAEIIDTTAEELMGRSFWTFVSEQDRDSVKSMLDSLTPEHPERRIENRLQTAKGERWILWTNRAIRFDDDGTLLEAQSAGIDITRRKQMEVALHESDRRKDEFLATLAHELRNPLAPIQNSLEILKAAEERPHLLQQARGAIERQMAQLIRLVDDLLDVSRITRDKLELRKTRTDLGSVLEQALENCRLMARERSQELVFSPPAAIVWLDADPVRLTQVFNNLIHNACRYTPEGGRIALAVEKLDGEAVVTIRDNGVGIPADKLESIFEMFAQVQEAGSGSGGGLGIGLTLVKRLVELHGGSVVARSPGIGKGSEMIVRLPVSAAPAALCAQEPGADGVAGRRRVLVVDDNVDNAESLAMLLELGGHETRTVHDGLAAVQAAGDFRPDVVLLDLGLPVLNGLEVCRRIRREPWGRGILIAALTGWGQERDRRDSEAAGFDVHLVKPVDLATLTRLLAAPAQRGATA